MNIKTLVTSLLYKQQMPPVISGNHFLQWMLRYFAQWVNAHNAALSKDITMEQSVIKIRLRNVISCFPFFYLILHFFRLQFKELIEGVPTCWFLTFLEQSVSHFCDRREKFSPSSYLARTNLKSAYTSTRESEQAKALKIYVTN